MTRKEMRMWIGGTRGWMMLGAAGLGFPVGSGVIERAAERGGAMRWQASDQPSHAEVAGTADMVVRDASLELRRTFVTPTLLQAHVPGTSMLWCATFQIAWDKLGSLGGPVTLEGDPPMAKALNDHPFPAGALDEASHVAVGGVGPETVDAIKAELARKFKGAASPTVLPAREDVRRGEAVAYAYLFKNLGFETPLTRLPRGMSFESADRPLAMGLYRAFGVIHETKDRAKAAAQVRVWKYESPEDFVIELRTSEKADRLIIARAKPGATLAETVGGVRRAYAKGAKELLGLAPDEVVWVPVLNFDITRSYAELTGIPGTSKKAPVPAIGSAKQNIRFRLDDKGAVLKSDAALARPTSAAPRPQPQVLRQFICNGPFLVVLEREGAEEPYFAAWIANSELLVEEKD